VKIIDKVWLIANKNEPAKWLYYLTIFFAGFTAAVVVIVGILVLRYNIVVGSVILSCAWIASLWSIIDDNKRGYVKALHTRHVELWKERQKRLGVK